jgi:hypothetical protein
MSATASLVAAAKPISTASPARIAANRANALKSKGPTSIAGKERSRRNGLKHGLTGQGIVVADQDAAEVDRRAATIMAELDPQSTVGRALVGQLATLSVRMERAARQEEAALAGRVRRATEAFDHDRLDRVEDLFDAIADDPRRHVLQLIRMPEGIDRLVEAWDELKDILTRSDRPNWTDADRELFEHLLGRRPERARGSRDDLLCRAIQGDPEAIAGLDRDAIAPEARRAWARDRLVERIDDEVAALIEHRETLDFEAISLDRLEAPDRALFDTSRDATLARRYESDASRRFFKALKELRQAEAEFAAQPAPKPTQPVEAVRVEPGPARVPEALGSSCAESSPTPRRPEPAPRDEFEWPKPPRDGAARGLDGRVIAVGRAVVVPR